MLVLQNKKVKQHTSKTNKTQGKTRQDRARQDKTRRHKKATRRNKTRHDKTRQDEAAQDKARPANARQGEADKQASWATLSCLVGHFVFFLRAGVEKERHAAPDHLQSIFVKIMYVST